MYACSHHCTTTRSPGVLSVPLQRYVSDCVAMYYTTMFFLRWMYYSIIWNPDSSLAVASKVYSHFPSVFRCMSRPVKCGATWSWNSPRNLPIRRVTTHVSAPKISNAWTTALKKNPDIHSSYPSLLRILVILFHNALALVKFRTTAGQLSSVDKITLPRYWKEVTISRGSP